MSTARAKGSQRGSTDSDSQNGPKKPKLDDDYPGKEWWRIMNPTLVFLVVATEAQGILLTPMSCLCFWNRLAKSPSGQLVACGAKLSWSCDRIDPKGSFDMNQMPFSPKVIDLLLEQIDMGGKMQKSKNGAAQKRGPEKRSYPSDAAIAVAGYLEDQFPEAEPCEMLGRAR